VTTSTPSYWSKRNWCDAWWHSKVGTGQATMRKLYLPHVYIHVDELRFNVRTENEWHTSSMQSAVCMQWMLITHMQHAMHGNWISCRQNQIKDSQLADNVCHINCPIPTLTPKKSKCQVDQKKVVSSSFLQCDVIYSSPIWILDSHVVISFRMDVLWT